MTNYTILINTSRNFVPYLKDELMRLGYTKLSTAAAGVSLRGSMQDIMRLNLNLRCAHHVLLLLREFECRDPEQLYRKVYEIDWENVIDDTGYVSVFSNVNTPTIRDTRFANLKCKDAIVDRIANIQGKRPDSGPEKDRTVVYLYWQDTYACVYLDTSGESLSRRGYRKIPLLAPLQETLAAGIIAATEWDTQTHFINPMCGSGTLAIEAALAGLQFAPGLSRENFGFMHIKGFDASRWQDIRHQALAVRKKKLPGKIIASDIDTQAIDASHKNARSAGVEDFIEFQTCDFASTQMPGGNGTLVINPEYGQRLGSVIDLEAHYKDIGDFFKQKCLGKSCFVFTGNMKLAKKISLKPDAKTEFYNADIPCVLLKYEVYEGSKKIKRKEKVSDETKTS